MRALGAAIILPLMLHSPGSSLAAVKEESDIVETLQQHALPDLIHSITEKKSEKHLRLMQTVGDVRDHRANVFLLQAYRDAPNDGVRCKILESLGKLHDPSLFSWFVQRLNDHSIAVQCFSIWALGELKTPEAVKPLHRKLWNSNAYIQMTAINALGKTGRNQDLTAELLTFLNDDDVQIRFLTAKALEGTAERDAVPELFERLADEPSLDVQEALATTLGRVGGSVAVGHFVEVLKNSNSQAKQHWAEAGLAASDPRLVIPEIAPALSGNDFRLKVSAARILRALEANVSGESIVTWVSVVREWTKNPDPGVRDAASQFLERIRVSQTPTKP